MLTQQSMIGLPLWARCALERLQGDPKLRIMPSLEELLEGYAQAMGVRYTPDDGGEHENIFLQAERIARKTWDDFTY